MPSVAPANPVPQAADSPRKIVTTAPENSETPLDAQRGWITPTESFFVRNHFAVPQIDLAAWRLRLTGCIDSAAEFRWDELDAMPQRSVFATLECAGNGRSYLEQRAAGVQWGRGAVGNAEWSGVPFRDLVENRQIDERALEIVFQGADQGREGGVEGEISFARSLPLDVALHPDTVVALRMNGEPLTPGHGRPARLIMPGWYGVASVKWLAGAAFIDRPFDGYFQTVKYTVERHSSFGKSCEIVAAMRPKSEIIRPVHAETLKAGRHYVEGIAWAGSETVAAVEFSCDGGCSWRRVELTGPQEPYCWTTWRACWEVSAEGKHALLSRAISSSGEVQPMRHDPLNGGYIINFSRPIEVNVCARGDCWPRASDPQCPPAHHS